MPNDQIRSAILDALEAHADDHGIDIVDVEIAGSKARPLVRVRIDTLDDETIDMDRVCDETAWVSDIVEALDPFTAAYDLEVSSPGVDRPLRRPKDFAAYLGDRAEVTTVDPIDGRRSWTGDIVAVTETSVTVLVDGTEYEIPLASIKRANLKPDYDALLAAAKKSAPISNPITTLFWQPRRSRRRRRRNQMTTISTRTKRSSQKRGNGIDNPLR